ncbi:unnamed protein product [Clavelina lepadiformis]|uniref:Membralin n=1 Tax=Clavelina lepadiformis TaxID=159417 RepID=A0ABP0FL46_CLALP
MADAAIIGTGSNTSSANAATPQIGNRRVLRQGQILRNNVHSHEGVFMHYLFLNLSLRYTSYFKYTSRRLLEFFSLINALGMFFVLMYIHVTFVQTSSDCLSHVDDIWPRDGILRVQISRNESVPQYKMYFVKEPSSETIALQSTPYNIVFRYSSPITKEDLVNFEIWNRLSRDMSKKGEKLNHQKEFCENPVNFKALQAFGILTNQCPMVKDFYFDSVKTSLIKKLTSFVSGETVEYYGVDDTINIISEELAFRESMESSYDPFEPVPIREHYVIEYSSEFGYLRLSTAARHKLGIPTLVVNLNPEKNLCFGSGLKKYMLQTFLGYDDFLMTSIKKMAEKDKSQGYLRNLVTGEYFRFVTMWVSNASGIIAFSAMIIFTLIVTMLLRYSYNQIFMFMVEVLRLLDTDVRLVFPAAPMLTIILALVGMEEIMTEFFHDSTVAFYVILLIWFADQFDAICLHTIIGRRHWVRFFFFYHLAFYIYHYKFNGQYSKLALFTSWLFIFHSMLYFLHHYEFPAIQRQIAIISARNRPQNSQQDSGNAGNNPQAEQPNVLAQEHSSTENIRSENEAGVNQPPTVDSNENHESVDVTVMSRLHNRRHQNWSLKFIKENLCNLCVFVLFIAALVAVVIHTQLNRLNYASLELVRVVG